MEQMERLQLLHPDSPVRAYLKWMDLDGNDALYRERYAGIVQENETDQPPFLTVVIRTLGNRPDMLQDVFTCLQAQSDPDFEVIVVCHRAEKQKLQALRAMIRTQPEMLAQKTRMIQCEYGERGAPLNLGFAYACGRYAVCLDDDDLVLEDWVKAFHDAEKEQGGKILHSWAVVQPWQAIQAPGSTRQILRATDAPDSRYCVPYRTLHQQVENHCPFMGLAFPLFLFRSYHVLFDETLTTTEDWDYLLRTAGIAGVWDIRRVTAIYRLWNVKDASRNLVREPEWKENYRQISERMNQAPLLVSAAEAAECRDELTGLQSAGQKGRSAFFREAVLFWSNGEPFSDRQYMAAPIMMKDGWIRARFSLSEAGAGGLISQIRIDPAEETLFALDHISVRLLTEEKTFRELTAEDIRETNGLSENGCLLFLSEDPRIVLELNPPVSPCTVLFTARVTYRSPEVLCRRAEELCADERWLAENRNVAHLYTDQGDGFLLSKSLACGGVFKGEDYQASFDIPPEMADRVSRLRFDPTEAGRFRLDYPEFRLTYADHSTDILHAEQISWLNGFVTEQGIAFIERDPYLEIEADRNKTLRSVVITGKGGFLGAEEMEDRFAEAIRVPDYRLVCEQMNRMRKNRWKEEAGIAYGS